MFEVIHFSVKVLTWPLYEILMAENFPRVWVDRIMRENKILEEYIDNLGMGTHSYLPLNLPRGVY